jgi:hypothetical protein
MYRYAALLLWPFSVVSVGCSSHQHCALAYVYVSTSKGINLYDVRVPHIRAINTMGVADGSY